MEQCIAARPALPGEIFEQFPYGLLVLDAEGRVSAANRAGRRLLGEDGETTCCALFGCGRPGTPLEGGCLARLAGDGGVALPEVRLDLPDRPVGAIWVTAGPLSSEAGSVVLMLRPGQRGDRRRRTAPHWLAGPQLRISTLGGTTVQTGETPLPGAWLQQRPGHILKYLVTHRRRPVAIDEVADVFWPQHGRSGLTNVRYCVHVLRGKLEPDRSRRAPSSFVLTAGGSYRLEASRVEVDADAFDRLMSSALTTAHRDPGAAERPLEEALGLYAGDFLADEPYADWVQSERDRLRDAAVQGLGALSRIRLGRGDDAGATATLRRLTEIEPYDLAAHRRLLAVTVRRGRHSEAARMYDGLRRRMSRQFGEGLDFTLADVAGHRDELLAQV
jgi:DNA-binding SARP family transcriptional activator